MYTLQTITPADSSIFASLSAAWNHRSKERLFLSASSWRAMILGNSSRVNQGIILVVAFIMIFLTTRITDRRRKRALAANPAFKEPGASKLKRGAAVRVHPLVRHLF